MKEGGKRCECPNTGGVGIIFGYDPAELPFVQHAPGQCKCTYNLRKYPQSIDIKKLRERLGMSQPEFALRFGFSLGTLRQWEQGRRSPDLPARVLLTVISHSPKAVTNALEKEARKVSPKTPARAIG